MLMEFCSFLKEKNIGEPQLRLEVFELRFFTWFVSLSRERRLFGLASWGASGQHLPKGNWKTCSTTRKLIFIGLMHTLIQIGSLHIKSLVYFVRMRNVIAWRQFRQDRNRSGVFGFFILLR